MIEQLNKICLTCNRNDDYCKCEQPNYWLPDGNYPASHTCINLSDLQQEQHEARQHEARQHEIEREQARADARRAYIANATSEQLAAMRENARQIQDWRVSEDIRRKALFAKRRDAKHKLTTTKERQC